MDWLYENPLPEICVCAVLAAGFVIATIRSQRGVYLVGAVAFVLLGLGAWFLDRNRETDREAVHAAVYKIVDRFQQDDLDGTLALISPRATDLRSLAQNGIERFDVQDVRVTDVSIELTNENSIGSAHFRVNATVSREDGPSVGHRATRWRARWQKSDQGWLMTDLEPLDIVTGLLINLPDEVYTNGPNASP